MLRYKRNGWYGESHRHYLAAKGIKTRYNASKPTGRFAEDRFMREQRLAEELLAKEDSGRILPFDIPSVKVTVKDDPGKEYRFRVPTRQGVAKSARRVSGNVKSGVQSGYERLEEGAERLTARAEPIYKGYERGLGEANVKAAEAEKMAREQIAMLQSQAKVAIEDQRRAREAERLSVESAELKEQQEALKFAATRASAIENPALRAVRLQELKPEVQDLYGAQDKNIRRSKELAGKIGEEPEVDRLVEADLRARFGGMR